MATVLYMNSLSGEVNFESEETYDENNSTSFFIALRDKAMLKHSKAAIAQVTEDTFICPEVKDAESEEQKYEQFMKFARTVLYLENSYARAA